MARLALISDIHGNSVGLDAVLADATVHGADKIVCLGDVAAGGTQPREVIRRLREVGCRAVRGNADGWLLDGLPPGRSEATRRLGEVVGWARALLTADERAFLAWLPPTLTIALGGWTLLCCHGSPRAEVDALLAVTPDAELDELLADTPAADALVCGHTHLQLLRRHRRGLLLNPGSVGLPLGSLAARAAGMSVPASAEYAIVDVEGGDVEIVFRRIPVDVDALAVATAGMTQASWASDLGDGSCAGTGGPSHEWRASAAHLLVVAKRDRDRRRLRAEQPARRRSAECNFPPSVSCLPVVTSARVETRDLASAAIDAAVRVVLAEERSLYSLDADLNAHLAPDLILTQDVCQVCAVPSNEPALCSLGVEVAGYERQVVAAVAAAEVDTRVADQIVIAQGGEDVGVERQRRLLAVAAGVVLDVPGARGGTQLVTLRDQSRIVAAGADGISEGARS